MKPYYEDDAVTLYLGDFRDYLPVVGRVDAIVTDPPYGETSLEWDRWPKGWPSELEESSKAMWCFGSFRMFMDNLADFEAWKFSHEIVWEKHTGSGFTADKFRRVHELATLWYRGDWSALRHEVPRIKSDQPDRTVRRHGNAPHMGKIASGHEWNDDGTRMQKSVIRVRNEHRRAVHPTQKPLGIVMPLIEYSVPVGGLVLDPFAGSGTTLLAARMAGRRAIGVEANEKYAEGAARRLAQQTFEWEETA